MKNRTQSIWVRLLSIGVFTAMFAAVLMTLIVPTQALAVCEVHTCGDWWMVQAPTCTENGISQRDCRYCDTHE